MSESIREAFEDPDAPEEVAVTTTAPSYRVMADSKIPVSKSRGKLWKARKEAGVRAMKDIKAAWDESIRYYNHDQSSHRDGGSDPDQSGNMRIARRLNDKHSSTENVVFANVNAQLPELYAKNPIIELTAPAHENDEEWKRNNRFISQAEKLVNSLFSMRVAPGINLKPKGKRATVISLLTNNAWFEVGYIQKETSSDQAMEDLLKASEDLRNAKTPKEIEEVEARIFALEERIEFLRPSGPYVRVRLPGQVIVDPDSTESDQSDANWIMVEDLLSTQYLNAVYGTRTDDDGTKRVESVYEPTHLLDGGSDEDDQNASLFSDQKDYAAYGYDSQESFDKAKRTKVWYVWDKTTRRLELYSDKNWSWPIWVWDDPYQLDQFFPLFKVSFHENPVAPFAKGEVSYYLDQQDEINEINDEARRARAWARRNIFYNKNRTDQATADNVLSGAKDTAIGLDVPDGIDPKNIIFSIPPPSANFSQLFDKRALYMAIDRIAATNDVMRGAEFKTNTTNQAIDYYATQGNKRADERLDAIEEAIAHVGWLILQLCLRFMPVETASKLIGQEIDPQNWQPIDPLQPTVLYAMRCVGGSTTKPSGQAKKQEAIQVGQVLAQYVRAAPGAVLGVTLRMFSEAFDSVVIHEQDWAMLREEITAAATQGQNGGPGGGQPSGQSGQNPQAMAAAVVQALEQLPPQVLQAIGSALAKGVPPRAILQQMMQQTNQGAPQ